MFGMLITQAPYHRNIPFFVWTYFNDRRIEKNWAG
jgi:hypothetical protein